jgi:D-alanyl-D-alanine carboxypeptidase
MISSFIINIILSWFFLSVDNPVLVNSNWQLISLKSESPAFTLNADKGAVLSVDDRSFLFKKNADKVQPIASITKLMTALVFLDHNPGWEEVYEITPSDNIPGGRLNLFLGEKIKIKDLFYTSLIASDNGATIALVHASGISEKEFVEEMNNKAHQLSLFKTKFSEPIGLSDNNVSTAAEVAWLAKEAFNQKEIRETTQRSNYEFTTVSGQEKKIESTDYLLFDSAPGPWELLGGKTGYTDQAGYCFVGRFKDSQGRELISAVLGSDSKNNRFKESKSLVNWVWQNYIWSK